MYFTLKAVLRSLLLPPASPLILALFGMLLLRRWRRLGFALILVAGLSIWLFSTPLIADTLSRLAERSPVLDLSRPIDAQAIDA